MEKPRPTGGYVGTAIVVAVLITFSVLVSGASSRWQPEAKPLDFWAYGCLLAAALSLFLRYRSPALMVCLSMVFCGLYLGLGYPPGPQLLAFPVAVVFALMAGERTVSWVCVGIAVSVVVVLNFLEGGDTWWLRALAFSMWMIIIGLIGTGLRLRKERAVEQQRRRQEQVEASRSAERLALAQDIHDVVAHSLSTIHVRASVALHLADKDPTQVEPALQAIKNSSKEALQEVRELLGMLREDAPRQPTGSLERLPQLLDDARSTGLLIEQQVDLQQPLSLEQQTVSYRVIQEALTNIIRHADAKHVTVAIRSIEDSLNITVKDDGRGLEGSTPGHGMKGMRERVTAVGGSVKFIPGNPGLGVWVEIPGKTAPTRSEYSTGMRASE